jgi:hypothetical protein
MSTQTVWTFTRISESVLGLFIYYLNSTPPGINLLCNSIFSSSNKFKGYKITDLTRPIEFGPSNRSTSNKEPSGIQPLGRFIYNKDPSCYRAEHTLLGLLFPLWERSASKSSVSGAILPGLLGLGIICRYLSTQASFTMITRTRDWLQVNRCEQAKQKNWHGTTGCWNVSLITRFLLLDRPLGKILLWD